MYISHKKWTHAETNENEHVNQNEHSKKLDSITSNGVLVGSVTGGPGQVVGLIRKGEVRAPRKVLSS